MKAWVVSQPGPIETSPLRYVEKPVPVPAPGELLCAGIIGYRALLRASLPARGGLGLYGFGDSAHLVAQVALAQGATVHALTRGEASQRLALELGAASAGARMIPRRSPWTARSCSRQSRSSCSRGAVVSRSTVTSDSPFGLKFSAFPLFLFLCVRIERPLSAGSEPFSVFAGCIMREELFRPGENMR